MCKNWFSQEKNIKHDEINLGIPIDSKILTSRTEKIFVLPEEKALMEAALAKVGNSPFGRQPPPLLTSLAAKTIANTKAGVSAFVLVFADSDWFAVYLEGTELRWRMGHGKYHGDIQELLGLAENYHSSCDIGKEVSHSKGRTIRGLSLESATRTIYNGKSESLSDSPRQSPSDTSVFSILFIGKSGLNISVASPLKDKPYLNVCWEADSASSDLGPF